MREIQKPIFPKNTYRQELKKTEFIKNENDFSGNCKVPFQIQSMQTLKL